VQTTWLQLLAAAALIAACEERNSDLDRLGKSFACAEGDKRACDERIAEERTHCDAGQGHECVLLGIAYQGGKTVEKDLARAADLFERACELKEGAGCWYLGSAIAQALGRAKDEKAALAAYEKGCALDNINACYDVGVAHREGRGTAPDRARAKQAFGKACTLSTKPDGLGCAPAQDLAR
jgi:uncharacterized protein